MFIYLLPRCLSVIGGEKITCAIRLEAAAMMRSFIQKVSISTFFALRSSVRTQFGVRGNRIAY